MYNLQIECPSIQCVSVELICKPDGPTPLAIQFKVNLILTHVIFFFF